MELHKGSIPPGHSELDARSWEFFPSTEAGKFLVRINQDTQRRGKRGQVIAVASCGEDAHYLSGLEGEPVRYSKTIVSRYLNAALISLVIGGSLFCFWLSVSAALTLPVP